MREDALVDLVYFFRLLRDPALDRPYCPSHVADVPLDLDSATRVSVHEGVGNEWSTAGGQTHGYRPIVRPCTTPT